MAHLIRDNNILCNFDKSSGNVWVTPIRARGGSSEMHKQYFAFSFLSVGLVAISVIWMQRRYQNKSNFLLSENSISGQAEVFWGKTAFHNYPPGGAFC